MRDWASQHHERKWFGTRRSPSFMRIEFSFPSSSCDSVFNAWVFPDVMRKWLFVGPTNRIVEVTSDARIGGTFYVGEENDGQQIDHFGQYVRLDRPRSVAFELEVPAHFKGVSYLEVTLQPRDSGCLLTLEQSRCGPPDAKPLWNQMLRGLRRVVEE